MFPDDGGDVSSVLARLTQLRSSNTGVATLRFGISSSLDRSGAWCGHRGSDSAPVFCERGIQTPPFGVHTSKQGSSEFVERGLGGDPNLRQRGGRLFDGASPDFIGLSLGQPQGALRARTKAALARRCSPLDIKLDQDGPKVFLGVACALPVGGGRSGKLIDAGFDLLEIATEFVQVGIDLGAVIATTHRVESRWTGRRERRNPVTKVGDLPPIAAALVRLAGCIAHPLSSSAT